MYNLIRPAYIHSHISRHNLLQLLLRPMRHTKSVIVEILPSLGTIRRIRNRLPEESHHSKSDVSISRLEDLVTILDDIISLDNLRLGSIARTKLLGNLQDFVLSREHTSDVNDLVLEVVWLLQHAGDRPADISQCGGRDLDVSAVVELRSGVGLDVDEEPLLDAPVQERTGRDERVRDLVLVLLEVLLGRDLAGKYGELGGVGVGRVDAEFRGNEPTDTGFDGGVDDLGLVFQDGGADVRDDSVLSFQGGGKGGEVIVADCLDRD